MSFVVEASHMIKYACQALNDCGALVVVEFQGGWYNGCRGFLPLNEVGGGLFVFVPASVENEDGILTGRTTGGGRLKMTIVRSENDPPETLRRDGEGRWVFRKTRGI